MRGNMSEITMESISQNYLDVLKELGFKGFSLEPIQKLCEDLQVEYHIIHTQIGEIVFDKRKESSPCSLCAKMRKGALNNAVKKLRNH